MFIRNSSGLINNNLERALTMKPSSKAQFHRGLCYSYLCEPAKAKWCFVLASHLEDHEQTIRECQQIAERQVNDLPMGDPKKSVTSDFKFFCHVDGGDLSERAIASR